jgi:SHS2 domain-containing protein
MKTNIVLKYQLFEKLQKINTQNQDEQIEIYSKFLIDLSKCFYSSICKAEKIQALKLSMIKLDINPCLSNTVSAWFNELILYYNEDQLVFSRFERVDKSSQKSIILCLSGEKINPRIHRPVFSTINMTKPTDIKISNNFFKLPLDGSPAKPDK